MIDEEDEGLEPLTIYEAAKRWKDDVLTEHGWDNGIDTYYETPLKVVEVKWDSVELTKEQISEIVKQLRMRN